jgi:putative DNA primase/helicase
MESTQRVAERLTRSIGTLVKVYEYRNPHGTLAFCNLRIAQADGSKTFRMMSEVDGVFVLRRAEKPEQGWPLYGLASLASDGPAFAVEGEKDVDSLHALGLVAVTSGSTSTASSADWSPLAGREVILWPDNDDAGMRCMDEIHATLEAIECSVERIEVDALGLPDKGDCSDWLALHPTAGANEVLKLERVKETSQEVHSSSPIAEIVRGDTIIPVPVDWLWDGWMAAGKLHILGGQSGTGKTTIALALAAIITTGGLWPDGTRAQCGDVIMWSGEDDPADTLVPRLVTAGADMSRVHFVNGVKNGREVYPFDPAHDTESLRRALVDIEDPHLIVVDPIVSAVAGDSHKNSEVRRGLQPLVDLARDHHCALLGITHFSKGTGGRDPMERITGSLAFGALARVVLVTAKHEEENETRFLARAKSNIGPDGGGYVYGITQSELPNSPSIVASVVAWGESLQGTARELLAEAETQNDEETREAASFLRELLATGSRAAKDIYREAETAGFSKDAMKRAKPRIGAKAAKQGWRVGGTGGSRSSKGAKTLPKGAKGAHKIIRPLRSLRRIEQRLTPANFSKKETNANRKEANSCSIRR